MYLEQKSKDDFGKVYRIRERFKVGDKVVRKTLYNIGYIRDDDEQSLNYWKKFLKDFETLHDLKEQTRRQLALELGDDSELPSQNLGYCFIKQILALYDMLEVFAYFQRTHPIDYQLYEDFFFQVYTSLLDPSSVRAEVDSQLEYYGNFDIKLWDSYRSLDYIYQLRDKISKRIAQKTMELFAETDTVFFIDSTNLYTFTKGDEPKEKEKKTEEDQKRYLRQYGKSKENRVLPLIGITMICTSNGFPVLCNCYEGNQSDQRQIIPTLKKLEKFLDLKDYLICGDSGYNSATNNYYLAGPNSAHKSKNRNNNGFIFARPFRNSDEICSWILDKSGWKYLYYDEQQHQKAIEGEQGKLSPPEVGLFGYKSRIVINDTEIWDRSYSNKLKAESYLKQIVFFNPKLQKKKLYTIGRQIRRALDSLHHPSKIKKTFKKFTSDYVSINLKGNKKRIQLNREKIDEDIKLAGYYILDTSELDLNPMTVQNIYKSKAYIELLFRIAKSELHIRPIYLQTSNHIEAYVLIRFTALNILRVLQHLLKNKYSTTQILKSLKNFRCIEDQDNYIIFGRDEIIKDLEELFDLHFTKYMTRKEIDANFYYKTLKARGDKAICDFPPPSSSLNLEKTDWIALEKESNLVNIISNKP